MPPKAGCRAGRSSTTQQGNSSYAAPPAGSIMELASCKGERLKTSKEIYDMIKSDPRYDPAACMIIHHDRVLDRMMGCSAADWVPVSAGGDVPWHRVYRFAYQGHVFWDRDARSFDNDLLQRLAAGGAAGSTIVPGFKFIIQSCVALQPALPPCFSVASLNVLFAGGDGSRAAQIEPRLPGIGACLQQLGADVILLQECTPKVLEYLQLQPWVQQGYSLIHSELQPCGQITLVRAQVQAAGQEQISSHKSALRVTVAVHDGSMTNEDTSNTNANNTNAGSSGCASSTGTLSTEDSNAAVGSASYASSPMGVSAKEGADNGALLAAPPDDGGGGSAASLASEHVLAAAAKELAEQEPPQQQQPTGPSTPAAAAGTAVTAWQASSSSSTQQMIIWNVHLPELWDQGSAHGSSSSSGRSGQQQRGAGSSGAAGPQTRLTRAEQLQRIAKLAAPPAIDEEDEETAAAAAAGNGGSSGRLCIVGGDFDAKRLHGRDMGPFAAENGWQDAWTVLHPEEGGAEGPGPAAAAAAAGAYDTSGCTFNPGENALAKHMASNAVPARSDRIMLLGDDLKVTQATLFAKQQPVSHHYGVMVQLQLGPAAAVTAE